VSAIVVARLRDLFLAPEHARTARPAQRVADRTLPATLGVLVAPRDAALAGASLALAAASAHHAPCALVCRWTGTEATTPPRSGPAVTAARKLARRLTTRGLAASACGRLVLIDLPAAAGEARAAAERALAAAGETPTVLVVAGARPPALDPLLATLDRLIVVPTADAPSGLVSLAVTAAAQLGRGASLLHLPPTTTARLLATTGLPLSPTLHRAATTALRGDDA
jgi:hypothetical protein